MELGSCPDRHTKREGRKGWGGGWMMWWGVTKRMKAAAREGKKRNNRKTRREVPGLVYRSFPFRTLMIDLILSFSLSLASSDSL